MSRRTARWIVGVAVAVALLVAGFVVRVRYGWWFVGGPDYQASFSEVTGLGEGDLVRYAGLGVGRVRRVEIDPSNVQQVLVTFRVSKGTLSSTASSPSSSRG